MEARILDCDAAAMEMRFDLEAKTNEVDRLQRRAKELDAAYTAVVSAKGGTKGGAVGDAKGAGANRMKREAELQSVIEGLQNIVQKLRSENERLRAGAAESTQLAASRQDARKAQNEANALREQLALAKQQASGAADAGVRLARERDTVASLRAKLKGATD